jgi:MtrB/PioB family decaheme-associated outer membrane protein
MNANHVGIPAAHGVAFMLLAALAPVMRARADDAPAVDTSKWVCKYCTFEESGFSFTPNLGVGYVSDDSAKFGEYTGLNEQGAYVVADADGRYRGKDGLWLDLSAVDLGLDSRHLGVEGGRQGKYRLHLSYKQLPHNIIDTGTSPFLGIGTASLTLPSDWIPASTTGGMSALDSSSRGIAFETERRILDLGGALTPVQHWAFGVNVRHEEKKGTRGTGGTFVFNDSRLPMPVDYQTDQFDASAAYSAERFQARLAYSGSIFKNDDAALVWTNPYLPLADGGTRGQLALAPSNEFHQLVFSGAYRIAERAQVSGDIALGRMTQDEAFQAYTLNSSLPTQPLPAGSLDGRVATLTGNLRFTTTPTDKLRINASLAYDDRSNQTPQAAYDWITTDSGAAAPRTNLPYSFTHMVGSIDGAYPLTTSIRLQAGCTIDEVRRDLQEVGHTNEGGCWGKAAIQAKDVANFALKWTHLERTGSGYAANPDGTPPQNPLMRVYSMADRDRDEVKLRVDVTPGERFNIGLDTRITWDSYYATVIGLLDGRSWSVAADCSWMLSAKASATCYASHERIESRQANAEMLAPSPLWTGENSDTIDTAGAGFKYVVHEKFDLGLDYTFVRSSGDVTIDSATVGFPRLETRLNSARFYINFAARKKLSLRLSYWYEDYRSDDWALDGVVPSTIANVLAFGQGTPSYFINVVALSGRYDF